MTMMMMVAGSLIKPPERRTSKNGNEYAIGAIRVGDGDDALIINVTAFGSLAPTLAGLEKGDSITVAGNARVSTYQGKDGSTKAGASVTANRIMALVDQQAAPRPKSSERKPADRQQYRRAEEFMAPAGPREFADDIPF